MQRWKNRCCCCLAVPLVIILVVAIFWGERIAADYAYANAYKEIMTRYVTRMQDLSARPSPTSEASKRAQVTALVQRAESTATVNEEAAHSLKLLKPPEDFKPLHKSTLSLLVNTAQSCRGLAKSIRQSGLEALAGGYDQLDASQREALGQLTSALSQMNPKTPGAKGIMRQVQTNSNEDGDKKH